MDWIVFNYSLPSKQSSNTRVMLWRRMRRWGAIALAGGAYVLPFQEECMEAFQWLAQEIRTTRGEALIMRVEQFEGMTDQKIVDLFCAARADDYAELSKNIKELNKTLDSRKDFDLIGINSGLARLRRRYSDIARVDYFNTPEGRSVLAELEKLEARINPVPAPAISIPRKEIAPYRDKVWVTRPHPFVDRLASIWLIRRFIDPKAVIRYSENPQPHEVPFDINSAELGHQGNLCTFETIKTAFGLEQPGLRPIGEIVHEIDLHDGRFAWPETAGIETLLRGWMLLGLADEAIEPLGMNLFEGLFLIFSQYKPG